MLTHTEENYLKAIFSLSGPEKIAVSTNAVADMINTSAASVTDMIQKLSKKKLVSYHRYQGVTPTEAGAKAALKIIRKHRLWEVFLVQKLRFKWDEVHDVAEQLEHVDSEMLIEQLDQFLGFPKYDPHGDPIPNANGEMEGSPTDTISMLQPGDECRVISAKDSSTSFLSYLDKIQISLGAKICVTDFFEYDNSYAVTIDGGNAITLSHKVAENIYIEKL